MKIALDAMGGDHGSVPNIAGAKLFLESCPEVSTLFLVGQEDVLKKEAEKHGLKDHRIEYVPASEVVDMTDEAVASVRRKKDSSISRSVDLIKSGAAGAVVSAGHTGAAVAACTIKLRTIPGVDRAGILSPFPNEKTGVCYLIDAGANVDAKPEHLVQQAIMGWTYTKYVLEKKNPVIGLMSNGEEDSKGNAVTKEIFSVLAALRDKGFNFRGNIEGRDLFSEPVDVAVCDGFVGNVLLKGCEGTAKAMMRTIKAEIYQSWRYKLGAWLAKPAFKAAGARLDYETYGGSPLLGVNGTCIICHGSSGPIAIKNALRVAAENLRHHVTPHIEEAIRTLVTPTTAQPKAGAEAIAC